LVGLDGSSFGCRFLRFARPFLHQPLLKSHAAIKLRLRMGLLFSRCVSATRSELEGRYLRAALPIARELLSRSAEVRGMVRQRRDEALMQRIKTEMLRRIKRAGTIRRWELGRSFHNYRRWPHGAALASLLASGAVCPYMEKRSTWLRYYER